MVQDLIRYDILAQEALRGVIRKVLAEVAKAGLPGNHHFFITFLTGAPGVRISSRLKEKYPEQMTIVLQHQFWDMLVTDQLFEVGLSFGDIPEKLTVPFLPSVVSTTLRSISNSNSMSRSHSQKATMTKAAM